MTESETIGVSSASLVEYLQSEMEKEDVTAIEESTVVSDKRALDVMLTMLEAYEALGEDPRDHYAFDRVAQRALSHSAYEAVKEGDTARMNAHTGMTEQDERIDATGYEQLVKDMKPAAQQLIVKGAKGTGKTTKTVDTVRRLYSAFNGNLKALFNFPVRGMSEEDLQRASEVYDWEIPEEWLEANTIEGIRFGVGISEFLEFAKEDGEKVMVMDEFSTIGNQLFGGREVTKILGRVINALRKSSGGSTRLVLIGHQHDTDIAAFLRNQADLVLYAEGKKKEGMIDKGAVYRSEDRNTAWDNFKEDEPTYKIRGIQDVRNNSPWAIDTNLFATLDWDLDDPENQIQQGKLVDNWKDYQDEPEQDEQDVELELERCSKSDCGKHTKNTGDDETRHIRDTGYCYDHIPDEELLDDDVEFEGEGAEQDELPVLPQPDEEEVMEEVWMDDDKICPQCMKEDGEQQVIDEDEDHCDEHTSQN